MNRGDIVTIADRAGEFAGKPRPALVVQSDVFNETHESVVVCLITGNVTGHGLFRIALSPNIATGLRIESEIAIDKVQSIRRGKIGRKIGFAPDETMISVDGALRRWLAL